LEQLSVEKVHPLLNYLPFENSSSNMNAKPKMLHEKVNSSQAEKDLHYYCHGTWQVGTDIILVGILFFKVKQKLKDFLLDDNKNERQNNKSIEIKLHFDTFKEYNSQNVFTRARRYLKSSYSLKHLWKPYESFTVIYTTNL
jgi:hypothetical protein